MRDKIKFRAWVGAVKHKCVAMEFAPDCRKSDIVELVCKVKNDLLKPLEELQERCMDYDDLAGVIVMKSCITDMGDAILKRLDEVGG